MSSSRIELIFKYTGWYYLFAVFSCSALAADEAMEYRERLQQLQSQIQKTQQFIHRAEGEKDNVQSTLMETEKKIGYIGRRLRIIRQDYVSQKKRHRNLEAETDERRNALAAEQQRLGILLRSAFQMGRYGDIRLLLNQQTPALLSRMMVYYKYFHRQRIAQIDRVNHKLVDLAKTRQELAAQTRTLKKLQQQREQELIKLEYFKVRKQKVLADINDSMKDSSSLLGQLRKDEVSLGKMLNSLGSLFSDALLKADEKQSFLARRGKLEWPSTGKLMTHFGSVRGITGKKWSGVVIGTEHGRDVRAVAYGRIVFSDWLRGYGLLVIIDHGDNYMSLYGHNESVFKGTGEWVEAGDVIASVGDSGGQVHSGLYFEIRRAGKPLNPVKWCVTRIPPEHG